MPWLSLLVFVPLAGALALSRISSPASARRLAIGVSGLLAVLAVGIVHAFDAGSADLQLEEVGPAILGARYHLGIDGLSVVLVPLVVALAAAVLIASPKRDLGPRTLVVILLTEAGTLGTLVSLDLVLLIAAWTLSLAPTYWLLREGSAGSRRV